MSILPLQPPPPTASVVADDLLEHRRQSRSVDRLAFVDSHGARRLVGVASSDDSFRIRHNASVVEKDVDVILGREKRANVAVEHEVRLDTALDRLGDRRIGSVDELTNATTDRLLP